MLYNTGVTNSWIERRTYTYHFSPHRLVFKFCSALKGSGHFKRQFWNGEKKPLPAQNILITPGPVYLWSIVKCLCLCSPSDQFKQMNSCLLEQLLPSNWSNDEENSCYLNRLLPVTLVLVYNFLSLCTMLILSTVSICLSQNNWKYMSYILL